MIISIETGSTVTKLGTKPVFNFTGSTIGLSAATSGNTDAIVAGGTEGSIAIGCSVEPLYNSVTITPELSIELPDALKYIKTINGVAPTQDGEFFIDGSECDSWDILESGTGISIVDLCPSCTKCESIYRLKYEVENLKMWLNTLKDVNLYLTAGGVNEVKTRALLLSQYRITGEGKMSSCSTGIEFDDGYLNMRGLQLLQQYITTVHMWNYIVSRNNASTVIDVAPEDTTGFTVQTKRALTSCACAQTICCTIRIRPLGILKDNGEFESSLPYPISVYVPDNSNTVRFEPLLSDEQQSLALNVDSCVISTAPKSSPTDIIYASTKTATTTEIPAKVAGTYVVGVKFLPFVFYEAWRDGEPISIRGGTATTISGKTSSDGTVTYDFGISGHTTYVKPSPAPAPAALRGEPTESDYLTAKTVPTCSVPFKIVWDVTITWQVRELVDDTWIDKSPDIENYQYTANGIRSYFGDILQNTEIPPEEPPEPENTSEDDTDA